MKLKNITEIDIESLIKIVSQIPIGGKYEDKYIHLERDDPFTFIINVKSDMQNNDTEHSKSIDAILFG